jgi:hypothetical protein
MRNLSVILIAGLLLSGCGSKELTRDEALQIIKKERNYPHVLDYDIFCSDPSHAKKVLDKGLEAAGMVIVHRTLKFKDVGVKPIIEFTDKAKPYLLTTSKEDQSAKIQKVKIADEDISEVTAIVPDKSNNTAVVEYTIIYKNITPFSVLMKKDLKQPDKQTAYFALSDKGWIIPKRR